MPSTNRKSLELLAWLNPCVFKPLPFRIFESDDSADDYNDENENKELEDFKDKDEEDEFSDSERESIYAVDDIINSIDPFFEESIRFSKAFLVEKNDAESDPDSDPDYTG